MPLVYKDGLKLPSVMCHRCGAKKAGTVKREMAAWRIHLSCGHVKHAGWTKPPEQFRKEGLVLTETPVDPRIERDKKAKADDEALEQEERFNYLVRSDEFSNSRYF